MREYDDLRPSQHEIADAIYENDVQMLVAGMGAGKTAGSLTSFEELKANGVAHRALVVAPPLVAATVWPREPAKWGHLKHLTVEALTGTPARRMRRLTESKADILAVSCHLSKWLAEVKDKLPKDLDVLIIDEPSFFKGPRSAQGKALRKITDRFRLIYSLTGTPRPNGYEDLWGQMMIMTNGKIWEPFDKWRRRNFMPEDPNGYRWTIHDFRAKQIDAQVAPYITSVEVDLDLEPLNAGPDFDWFVEMPPKAREKYDEMEDELIAHVAANLRKGPGVIREEDLEDTLVVALSQGVKSGKLAQIAQGYLYDEGQAISYLHDAKVEALREIREAAGDENLLIWYGYRADIPLIEKALHEEDLPMLGGDTFSKREQVRFIEDFGKGKIRNLLAHPASAAHGIDELKNGARRMVWFCPTWSAEQYAQALHRLYRPGQTRPVFSHQILTKGTVDMIKVNRVQYKRDDEADWTRLVAKTRDML